MKENLLEKINSVLEKIKEENFEFNKNSCYNCDLKIICGVEKWKYKMLKFGITREVLVNQK